jgi:hypothetical protein
MIGLNAFLPFRPRRISVKALILGGSRVSESGNSKISVIVANVLGKVPLLKTFSFTLS